MSDQDGRPFGRFLFLSRMTGATRLHSPTYEEVFQDESATLQALAVVALAAIATGIGDQIGLGLLPMFILSLGINWATWVFVILLVGATLLAAPRAEARFVHLVRTAGFAQSPSVFKIFGVFLSRGSTAHLLTFLVPSVWVLAATTLAVRQTFGYGSTFKSLVVVGVWFVPWVLFDLFIEVVFT